MIISASRRTDIPARHANWFMAALRKRSVDVVNPYTKSKFSVSLEPKDVDCVVFWTKDFQPMLPYLNKIRELGHEFYVQFTVNDYPRFEPGLRPLSQRLETFRQLADAIGPERVIWRFDPILVSSVSTEAMIMDAAESLAEQLSGATRQLIFSFADFYGSVDSNLKRFSQSSGITFSNVSSDQDAMERFGSFFAGLAGRYQLTAATCAEKTVFSKFGIEASRCIDPTLISKMLGRNLAAKKDKAQRPECGCAVSRDIGSYQMRCRNGCVYCYAQKPDLTSPTSESGRKSSRL